MSDNKETIVERLREFLDTIARAEAAKELQGILTEDRDHWRDRAQAAELKRAQLEERLADYDFEDSDRLRLLRDAIDDNLPWRDQETEDNGDYIECVTLVGQRLKAAERKMEAWRPIVEAADVNDGKGSLRGDFWTRIERLRKLIGDLPPDLRPDADRKDGGA